MIKKYRLVRAIGESGVSGATLLNSTKNAEEKMIMSFIVWSHIAKTFYTLLH